MFFTHCNSPFCGPAHVVQPHLHVEAWTWEAALDCQRLQGNTPKSLPLGCPGKEVIGSKVIGSVGDFTPRIYLPFIRIGEITHWSVHHWSDHFLGHPSTRTCLGEWSNLRMIFVSTSWFNQQLVIPWQFDLCDLFGMVEMLSDPFKGESWPPIT